jgi:hypothetical protein
MLSRDGINLTFCFLNIIQCHVNPDIFQNFGNLSEYAIEYLEADRKERSLLCLPSAPKITRWGLFISVFSIRLFIATPQHISLYSTPKALNIASSGDW